MKRVALLFLSVFVISEVCSESSKYTTKYDDVDLDEIIKSDRLLKNYVNCLLEKGKCTPDGAELKRIIPDALQTDCSKCSETQKNGSKKLIHHLYDNKREWWNELEAKYDKDGIYIKKYASEFDKSA
ncbi:ejaculatory bulb-specific protein 3-like [Zophobas morio]|uniref:ejaculatory bulb-specific protein 3-like n=1 Tax=Zophobas morio TaxID=2755281 RepID=UPI0030833882